MMTLLRMIALLAALLVPAAAGLAGDVAGVVLSVDGEVMIRDDKARQMPAETGMAVETGHMIKTENDSAVRLELADGSIFTIAANSTFVLDDFLLQGESTRGMTARMLRGAMQYVSTPGRFKKDNRRIYLDNVAASVRGTDFIGIIDRRIQVVLISGAVELSARSNSVMLDRRGHTVYLDRTGIFDEAFILPDEDIRKLGARLGWRIDLPPPPPDLPVLEGRPLGCAIIGGLLVCG